MATLGKIRKTEAGRLGAGKKEDAGKSPNGVAFRAEILFTARTDGRGIRRA